MHLGWSDENDGHDIEGKRADPCWSLLCVCVFFANGKESMEIVFAAPVVIVIV